jgi:Spy/CpxP family protein refolding chaperone
MKIKLRVIAAVAVIISTTATAASARDNDRSYLPPESSHHHRATEPDWKGAEMPRHHKGQVKHRHKRGVSSRSHVRANGPVYSRASSDVPPEEIILFLPRFLLHLVD